MTQNPCYMPLILDACCGSRMFWFDKGNPNCLFIDKRSETVEAKDSSCKSGLRTIEVKPDLVADFTEMPFENESFAMVVFDPPHLKTLGQNSWMAKKYGRLPDDWQKKKKKARRFGATNALYLRRTEGGVQYTFLFHVCLFLRDGA